MLDVIQLLVDNSLLRQVGGPEAEEPRYRMLETVREYGLERLAASGEEERARQRHASHFLVLAERAEPELWGAVQRRWLDRLETDHDNLRAALAWLDQTGQAPLLARLAAALAPFWEYRTHLDEGRTWLSRALETARPFETPPAIRAKLLAGRGAGATRRGDYPRRARILRRRRRFGPIWASAGAWRASSPASARWPSTRGTTTCRSPSTASRWLSCASWGTPPGSPRSCST
jgi:hypothetical protein